MSWRPNVGSMTASLRALVAPALQAISKRVRVKSACTCTWCKPTWAVWDKVHVAPWVLSCHKRMCVTCCATANPTWCPDIHMFQAMRPGAG
jgi:hypothetical protein